MEQKKFELAEITISFSTKVKVKPKIRGSQDVYDLLKEIYDDEKVELREEFIVLYLNRAQSVLGFQRLSVGGVTGVVVDIRHVLATALKANATGFILSHNHPSGSISPSNEDRKLTKRLVLSAEHHDLKVIDHVIYTRDGFYSFAEENEESLQREQ